MERKNRQCLGGWEQEDLIEKVTFSKDLKEMRI